MVDQEKQAQDQHRDDDGRDVRLFWGLTAASAMSKLGNQFLLIAVPVLIYELTGSAAAAVLGSAAQNAPHLLGPLIGPYVDRLSRKWLFVGSELVCAVAVALIPVAAAYASRPLPVVYALVFCVGLASVLTSLTNEFTFIPSLLGRGTEQVRRAYSLYNSVLDVARFVGPAVAGVAIVALGPAGALWFDAATFLGTAAAALALPVDRERRPVSESIVRSFSLGWARFRSTATLPSLTAVLALYNLGVGSVAVFIISVASGPWGWATTTVGWVISVGSLCSAAGAWVGGRLLRGRSSARRAQVWLAVSGASSLVMLVGVPWCAIAGFWAMSFAAGAFNVETLTYRRSIIPDEYAGRVNSIVRCFVAGAIPFSALMLAATADQADGVKFLPITISAVLAAAAWSLVLRRRGTGAELPAAETAAPR